MKQTPAKNEGDVGIFHGKEAKRQLRGKKFLLRKFADAFETSFVGEGEQPVESHVTSVRDSMAMLLKGGDCSVGMLDGRLATFVGHKLVYRWTNGRPVYVIDPVVTLPEARGRRIAPTVQEAYMRRTFGEHPDALFLVMTNTPAVRKWYGEVLGCLPISVDECAKLRNINTDMPIFNPQNMEQIREYLSHASIFLVDPTQVRKFKEGKRE